MPEKEPQYFKEFRAYIKKSFSEVSNKLDGHAEQIRKVQVTLGEHTEQISNIQSTLDDHTRQINKVQVTLDNHDDRLESYFEQLGAVTIKTNETSDKLIEKEVFA